ncbi:MAG: hypothetical protein LBH50_00425 [Spirochaetaceae bacterium]|jgi:hypothetical protein|nr:hypothetical protein [Spirochaetaceae bacterium]
MAYSLFEWRDAKVWADFKARYKRHAKGGCPARRSRHRHSGNRLRALPCNRKLPGAALKAVNPGNNAGTMAKVAGSLAGRTLALRQNSMANCSLKSDPHRHLEFQGQKM